MQGFQLSFYTQQNHTHEGKPVGEWIIEEAKTLGVSGATLTTGAEGFGKHHHLHATRFFELAEQPIIVTMAMTNEETDKFFASIKKHQLKVFYVKIPIEFGTTLENK